MEKKVLREMILNDKNVIYNKEFFESLKDESLLDFRQNIEMVQELRPSFHLREKVIHYYDELLSGYLDDEQIFSKYQEIIKRFQNRDYDFLENYHEFDELVNENMMIQIQDFYHYKDGEKLAKDFFTNKTNQKISEIVVDGLFEDTIYNVWLNIRELIRFYQLIGEEFEEKNLQFYLQILKIDEMSCKDKIRLYHKLKNQNISYQFYQDLRMAKDKSYQMIQDNLFDIYKHPELYNQIDSQKHGTPIYDLTGEDFFLFIRCMKEFSSFSSIRRKCYTLISNKNMAVFNLKHFIYGYRNVPIDRILHVFEKDAYSSNGKHSNFNKFVNRIMTPTQIANSIGYSEIQVVNTLYEFNGCYEVLKPDYLIVFDEIEKRHVEEARRIGIPIIRIHTKYYLRNINNSENQEQDLGFLEYRKVLDDYTEGNFLEETRKLNRTLKLRN